MALIVSFALLCALSLDNGISVSPADQPMLALIGLALFHAVVMRFAYSFTQRTKYRLETDVENHEQHLAYFDRHQRYHLGLWILVHLTSLYVLSWPNVVRVNWSLGDLLLVDDLIVLAPMCISWFVSVAFFFDVYEFCLLYTSPSPRDATLSRMPSSA